MGVGETEIRGAGADGSLGSERHQQLLIGGRWTDARSGRQYEQRFPYNDELVGTAAAAGREDAHAAADAAQAAFAEWSRSAPGMRRGILLKAADLLLERQQAIATTVTQETGGVFGWGMFNVDLAAGMLREAAAQAYGGVGEVIPSDVPGKLAMGVRQPAGVVISIAPWNAPVILATRAVAMPIAYANTMRPEGFGDLPADPCCGSPSARGRGAAGGGDQPDH